MNARLTVLVMVATAAFAGAPAAGEEEILWKDGKWVKQAAPAEGTPAGELALIRVQLDKGRYGSAARQAKRFLKRYPNDPLGEQACCLAGDAELRRGNYWQAYRWYENQIRDFPNGQLLDRALEREIEVARAFLGGGKRRLGKVLKISGEQDGIEILEKIAQRAVGTPRAEIALLTIADHYLDKGKWAEAAASYDGFLQLFPKSPRAVHAELRAAEAFHKAYRGPLYDETPLIEAEHRYQAFANNHPDKAREVKVEEILQEIHSQRAGKQYEVGQFYLRTGDPDAAKHYFELVASQFSDTKWAGRALGKLAALGQGASESEKSSGQEKGGKSDKETGS
jgi:outer membrane assembly lipoprotein YfiO